MRAWTASSWRWASASCPLLVSFYRTDRTQMAKVTRTTKPLPFEHLEPRRFEDLVRQLMYDFRDWQSIEATGHSGNDDGFDIRGHEKLKDVANRVDSEEDEDNEEGKHLLEGNEWMVQCKREKSIGPTKIR